MITNILFFLLMMLLIFLALLFFTLLGTAFILGMAWVLVFFTPLTFFHAALMTSTIGAIIIFFGRRDLKAEWMEIAIYEVIGVSTASVTLVLIISLMNRFSSLSGR